MQKPYSGVILPPLWLIRIINAFRAFLLSLNRKLFPGNVVLYEQFQNFWLLPCLYVAAKLDIASLLKDRPLTGAEIAERLNADPENVSRIMRALSGQGIFRKTRDGRYRLNGMANGLLDGPGSLRRMIIHHLGPVNWNAVGNLEYAVRTGKDPFKALYGKEIYEYLKEDTAENERFDRSMADLSDLGLPPVLNAYDFSRFGLIADIGGGDGSLLAGILQRCPESRGILFDAPGVLAKVPGLSENLHLEDRVTIVPGDFFQAVPSSCDLYVLKNIVHNWNDEDAIRLLGRIHENAGPGAVIVIIEMVVPEHDAPSLATLLDIQMMATMAGGKERTAKEYRDLLDKSGFSLTRIVPTIAPLSLIEARKRS